MKRKLKKLPKFRSEAAEARFWEKQDSTDYVHYSRAKRALFPRLKPSTETISLRFPKSVLNHVRALANKRDIPYQTLLKNFVAERIEEELRRGRKAAS